MIHMYILTCLKLLNIKDTTFAALLILRAFFWWCSPLLSEGLLLLLLPFLLIWFFRVGLLWCCHCRNRFPLGSGNPWPSLWRWRWFWRFFVLGFISGNLPHAGGYPPRCTYDMLCVCVGDCPPYYITIYRMCDIYTRVHPLCVMLTTNSNPEALELLELQHPEELDAL